MINRNKIYKGKNKHGPMGNIKYDHRNKIQCLIKLNSVYIHSRTGLKKQGHLHFLKKAHNINISVAFTI